MLKQAALVLTLLSANQLDSPQKYAHWIDQHVSYQKDSEAAEWAKPQITLNRGYGDCKDFAVLNREALKAMGFKPQLYVVTFSSLEKHAICVFKIDGHFALMSNGQLFISPCVDWREFENYLLLEHGYLLPKIVP